MLENLIFLIIFYSIKCMDIKLSLGSKLNDNNTYPVIITLKEPLISQTNNIDLFCVYDISGSMLIGNRTFYLKKALNLIIDTLNKNDRLSLIPFSTLAKTELALTEMNKSNKRTAKDIVNNIREGGGTNYNAAIDEFFKGIQNYTKLNDGRIKSIIFFTDGESTSAEKNSTKYLYNLLKTTNQKYDFTINTFGIDTFNPYLLMDFSDKRDGAFYSVNETNYYMMEYYVLNIIGAMRTTSFNFVNMKIESNYEITKIFGNNHLSNYSLIDSKIINNEVLQFISGKEYTYVIEVKLPDKIERGEKILNFNVVYTDVFGKIYQASNSLEFGPSIANPNLYREEYCRVWALELIENSIKPQSFKEVVSEIKKECGNDLNKNISLILDEILLLYDKPIRYNSFIYGVISEGILKRNGINLWYSNEYQYKLINDYIYGLIYELLINSKNN